MCKAKKILENLQECLMASYNTQMNLLISDINLEVTPLLYKYVGGCADTYLDVLNLIEEIEKEIAND